MVSDAFSFTLDHAQWRVKNDRLCSVVSGAYEPDFERKKSVHGWDERWGTVDGNGDLLTWVDPVTNTLMLRPAPGLKAWQTTGTGIYARLQKSDFTLANPSKWINHNLRFATDHILHGVNLTNEGGVTTSAWEKNRGFFLSFLVYSTGTERSEVHCGWNSLASGATGVSLRIFSDGDVEVWKHGALIETGNVGPKDGEKAKADGKWFDLFLIPFRKRELLVYSSLGGGFSVVFEDIDEGDPDPTITAATNFWFYIPGSARTMSLQIAPIRYPSGDTYRASIVSTFQEAPGSAETPELTIYSDAPGYGGTRLASSLVTEADPTVLFVPDNVTRDFRHRIVFTGDGEATDFVYGHQAEFPSVRDQTDDSESVVLDEYALDAGISFCEGSAAAEVSLTLKSPDAIEAAGGGSIKEQINRPFEVKYGEVQIMDCRTLPIRYIEAHGDENRRVTLEARDFRERLESYRFQDPTPLDGLTLRDAIEMIVRAPGLLPEDLDLDPECDTFELPSAGRGSSGDWSVEIQPGDTPAYWLDRIQDSYCGTWFHSIVPGPEHPLLTFKSPEEMGDDAALTLYLTDEDAIAEGLTEEERRFFVIRKWCESSLRPECNDIHILGMDPRTRRPISVHYPDLASQDPSLAPSSRPDNWYGEIIRYGYRDLYLSSLESCQRAAELLYRRLTKRRYMADFTCECLIDPDTNLPMWKGGVVEVFGLGKWRLTTGKLGPWKREPTEAVDFVWRESVYTAEKLRDDVAEGSQGCGHKTVGQTVLEMRQFSGLVIASKTVTQRGSERLEHLPVIQSATLP